MFTSKNMDSAIKVGFDPRNLGILAMNVGFYREIWVLTCFNHQT
jgi:hypothetical protein